MSPVTREPVTPYTRNNPSPRPRLTLYERIFEAVILGAESAVVVTTVAVVSRATGDIIGILNGDDYYMHPRVLDLYADKFENTHIGIAFGDLEYFPPSRPDKTIRTYSSRKFTREKLRLGWMPPHPTTFIRRSVYDTIGKYSTDYNISSDFEFLIRALWLHGIEFDRIDSVVVRMQYGGLSTKGLVSTYRLNQEIIRACRSNGLKTGWPTIMLKFPEKLLEFAPALRM